MRFGGHREFNTPAEMVARAAFLVMLLAFIGGVVLLVAAVAGGEWRLGLAGLGAWAIGVVTRQWLRRTGKLEETQAAFNAMTEPCPPLDQMHVAELVTLLQEWEAMEQRRGSPGFDPWALQALRHDIRELVENDPALEGLFREFRQRRAA